MSVWERLRLGARRRREVIRRHPRLHRLYRIGVGVVGAVVLVAGIIAIPYPGPGWLVVFLGLGILASEFSWAQRVLKFVRARYDAWLNWMKRQHWTVQGVFGFVTAVIVVATLWLVGALKMAAAWVGVHTDWLASPILG